MCDCFAFIFNFQVEQIHELAVQVGEKVAKAEALGERLCLYVSCRAHIRFRVLLFLLGCEPARTCTVSLSLLLTLSLSLSSSLLPGAEGKVDESLAMMAEIEEIKGKKKALEDEYHAAIPRHAAQQQKLRACEVCGAFLSMYDNDRRLADHFGGKLHIGFVTIREKIKQLEVRVGAYLKVTSFCRYIY